MSEEQLVAAKPESIKRATSPPCAEPCREDRLARGLRAGASGTSTAHDSKRVAHIEAEVRQAVVVFAEISGFMSRSLLRAFHKCDGLVLKVMATANGHPAMILFGAHRPTDNDDEKAMLASLEAITRLSSFRTPEDAVSMKVGIHRGNVLFGAVGSDSKHDLTAIGDAVNIAARVVAQTFRAGLKSESAVFSARLAAVQAQLRELRPG